MPTSTTSQGLEIQDYGLTPVHQDSEPQVDIVLVHGLNGHPRLTWAADEVFWPAELLPPVLKEDNVRARIMVYGWNANVFAFHGNSPTTDMIHHHAQTLIANLTGKRRGVAQRRPLVFIGHSLGGILIKRMLNLVAIATNVKVQHSIFLSTHGIIFLGTPHTGADPAKLGKMLLSMVHAVFPKAIIDTKHNLLDTLTTQSETLQNINVDFIRHVDCFAMYFFHESVETNLYLLGKRLIVDEHSASFLVPKGEYSGIQATHSDMCKYRSMTANGCELVTGAICSYALDAIRGIQKRWDTEDQTQELIQRQAARAVIEGLSGGSMIPGSSAVIPTSNDTRSLNTQESFKVPKMLPPSGDNAGPSNKHFYLPRNVSNNFTGRGEILRKVEKCLLGPLNSNSPAQQRKFVLYGLGGSGKSQLCLKFAEDHRERFWGVFWVNASSYETAEQGFAEIAKIGGVKEDCKGKTWLSHRTETWLLIIDSADDPGIDISEFFPPGNRGCLLITTRNPDCRGYGSDGFYHEVKAMNSEESMTLLLKTAAENVSDPTSRSHAELIVRELGCLPLAIVQAGAAIRKKRCHLKDYLVVYTRNRRELMENHPGQGTDGYKDTVYTTWEISRQMIQSSSSEVSSDAIDFLDISAFLHYENVPEEVLKEAPARQASDPISWVLSWVNSFYPTAIKTRDSDRIRRALVLLSSFSLITIDAGKDSFSMHRLVHSWTRHRLNEQDQRWCRNSATLALANSIQWQTKATDYAFRRRLLTHVDFLLHNDNEKTLMNGSLNTVQSQMAAKFALVYSDNGKFNAAEEMSRRSLAGMENSHGKDHLNTLQCVNSLASVLRSQGKYDEAEKMCRRALAGREKVLGKEHQDTMKTLSDLASVMQDKGKYDEAEKINKHALEQRGNVLGTQHQDTIESLNNLSFTLQSLGKYEAAAKISKRALDAREEILGPEHPDTMQSVHDLALVLQHQGDYDAAEKMHKQALERREKALGKDHPDTLMSVSRVAWILLKKGKYEDAEKMNRRALNGRETALGPIHPDTLASMSNLAAVLQKQANYDAAEEMNRRALSGYKEILGLNHPDTFTSMSNLANVLWDQDKHDEAEDLHRHVLVGREKNLGPLHPETLSSMGNLAVTLEKGGKLDEAEDMSRRALDGNEKELGLQHPDTLANVSNLAWILQKRGKYETAEEMYRRALDGHENKWGPKHPETLMSVFYLAYLLHIRKQYDGAYSLYQRACEGYKECGLDDPNARACSKYFSSLRQEMKMHDIAEPSINQKNLSIQVIQEIQKDTPNLSPDLQPSHELVDPCCNMDQQKRCRRSFSPEDALGSGSKRHKGDGKNYD